MSDKIIPIFRATVEGGKLRLKDAKEFAAYIARLEGQDVFLTVRKKKWVRSLKQNAYYHGVVVKLISDDIGEDHETTHELLKGEFNYKIITIGGEEKRVSKTTATLSIIDFNEYIEKCRRWASSFLGVRIPDPNEVEMEYEYDDKQ